MLKFLLGAIFEIRRKEYDSENTLPLKFMMESDESNISEIHENVKRYYDSSKIFI